MINMPGQKEIDNLQNMDTEAALELFKSNFDSGLKQAEVEKRLKQHGYNEVPEKKTNPILKFIAKFWGLTAWMLELIIILSWFLHKESDAYIVLGLLVFNAIIGFAQEQNAANAVEALKKKLQVNAKVLRDGEIGRAHV